MSQKVSWMEGEDVLPCQEVMPGSEMCQRSRWSSLCPPGSGGEGWDLFSFVSEKWLCPSCAGLGPGWLPRCFLPGLQHCPQGLDTHTLPSGGAHRGLGLAFLFYNLFI